MIDWAIVKKCLHDWVKDVTDQPCIWEDQSEQRPNEPYASIKITSGPGRIGTDQFENADADLFAVSGLREFTLSVNIFKESAFEKAHHLNSSIEEPMILERFQNIGMAYIAASPVRDLTKLTGPRFESRYQFDVRFRVTDTISSDPGIIETAEIENQIVDETFTVP